MSLNLYDVLDVDPSATQDEVRAAWKAAIADLGPGDRRFRAYNEAAEILLDPERRAAYDAEVALEPVAEPEPEPAVAAERSGVAPWLVAAVGVLAAAVLAVTIYVWATFESGADKAEDSEQGVDEAVAAAEEAAVPVLSYDYRSLAEDIVDAESYMTTAYAAQHSDLMNDLRDDVVSQKTIVDAQLQGSAVVRVTAGQADVLVLVNQVTEKAGTDPFLLPVWATLRMVNQDGEWLVSSITNDGAIAG